MRPVPQRVHTSALALIVRGVAGLVILAIGGGIYFALAVTRPEPPRVEQADAPTPVQAMTVQLVPARRWWEGYGAARAVRASDLDAEVAGVVVERPESIDPGAWVEAGALIVAIDDEEFRQRLEQSRRQVDALEAELLGLRVETESHQDTLALAEQAVEFTRNELERLREAEVRGAATGVEIQRLQRDLTRFQRDAEEIRQRLNLIPSRRAQLNARIQSEQAAARLAALNLERSRITAPFAGSLQSVTAQEGERLNIGDQVARLVDLRRMEIPLRAPLSAVSEVRVGNPVAVQAEGPVAREWTAHIARIAPEADPQTRTATIFVELEQPGAASGGAGALLPGQFVTARIFAADQRERVVVPRTAVSADRVLVVDEEGRVRPRSVRVSFHIENDFPSLLLDETQWAVVETGLAPGDRVIITNIQDLEPGELVRPVDAPEGPSP